MESPVLPLGCEPRCPGCAHRHLSETESLGRKTQWLSQRLARWQTVLSAVRSAPAPTRWRYRDRVCLSAGWSGERWGFGLTRDDELIPIPDCPVHSPRVSASLALLASRLPPPGEFPLAFYVQAGAQITLILKTAAMPPLDWLTPALTEDLAQAGVEGLWLHLHPSAGRLLFHKNGWRRVWGAPRSRDALGLAHGPAAFQQLLPALYAQSLDEAADFLAPGADSVVVDLYCGAGASLARWRAAGAAVIGVELGAEAVACAAVNAPGATVLRGTCAQRLPQLDAWLAEQGKRPLLYVNPPRTGLEPAVLDWIVERARPARLAYLSCSAGTLHRDLSALDDASYRIERITPYDFFPQTYHVETLALLSGPTSDR